MKSTLKKALVGLLLSPALLLTASPAISMQKGGKASAQDVWKPAATPKGGTPWSVLEATREITRNDRDGYIYSKPVFIPQVKALAGKRITMAGWMQAIKPGSKQAHFVLLAYPPGCPFHFHALPNQFIEVYADIPFPLDERKAMVVSGVLELTGHDESGIFYRMRAAKRQ